MRRFVTILFLFLVCCTLAYPKGTGGHHSSGKTSKGAKATKAKKSKANKSEKTVHVSGYTRKDGKYVAPYDRRSSGTATASTSTTSTVTSHTYRKDYLAHGYSPHPTVTRDKHGRIKRSKAAKA